MAHALPNAASFLILLFLLLTSTTTLALSQSSSSSTSGTDLFNWLQSRSTCRDTFADCIDPEEDDEFDLDSESNRRILATSSYISYGALNRNRVPCSRRGASYYNCQAGAQANPYSRGCSAITRCRS